MPIRHRPTPSGALVLGGFLISLGATPVAAQSALRPAGAGAIPSPVLSACAAGVVADSLGMGDDSLPADALPPESGMVLVDRNGHELHAAPAAGATAAERYASSGSAIRPRCAAEITPPPRTTSSAP